MSWLKLPKKVKSGEPVRARDFNALLDALRMVAVVPGVGYFLKRTAGGTALEIRPGKGGGVRGGGVQGPYHLSLAREDDEWKWTVSSALSSITDGINGEPVEVAELDTPTSIEETKYIVIEAQISENFDITGWTVSAVDEEDAVEAGMDAENPDLQRSVRLLVGKITFSEEDEKPAATQACFSSQRLVRGAVNGLGAYILEAAPTHFSKL